MLRSYAARLGLGLAGLFLAVHPATAQPADPNSAETLANRLGQAIDAGDANAVFLLAEMYRSGENQLPRDLARAVSLYKTAARLGNHPMAMNALGILYEQGWGVKASQALALQWYGKAARAGSAMAMANLGKIHARGDGVLQDYRLAVVELKKAAGDWVTVRVPASELGIKQDSPFRFSAASIVSTKSKPEIDWGYSRRAEWDGVSLRKFVFDSQFDSVKPADITVADVRSDGDDLLLDIAVFDGAKREDVIHFIWFFDTDGRESGIEEFRLQDALPLEPERLPHADRALQIVLRPGPAAPLSVFLLSRGKPRQLDDGRFIKGDNVAAQYDLGIIYARGKKNPLDVGGSIKQNLRLAADWFFRAAAERPNHPDYSGGHAGAQNNIGVLYSKGNMYQRKDRRSDSKQFEPEPYVKAAEWFRRAAAQDYREAYSNLGFLYEQGMLLKDASGLRVPSLYSKALGFYQRAADPEGIVRLKGENAVAQLRQNVPGLTVAQYNLGSLFDPDELIADGLSEGARQEFQRNKKEVLAEFWYGQAAAKGHVKAQVALAKRVLDRHKLGVVDREEAIKWLWLASDKSDGEAFKLLEDQRSRSVKIEKIVNDARVAADLFLPNPEARQETDEARQNLERLAALATQGDMQAAHDLARAFHLGTASARQDYTRAFRLYKLAAEEGHPAAQFRLGMLYSTGNGIPYLAKRGIGGFSNLKRANNVEAAKWYKKAADNGHGEAAFYLGNLYASGSIDLKQDYKRALDWYRKADSLGNVDALNNLGYLHDEGLGTPRDQKRAGEFYTRGAEAGSAGAQMNLSAYYFEGLGELNEDLGKALHWAQQADNQGEPGAAEKVTAITKLMKSGKK